MVSEQDDRGEEILDLLHGRLSDEEAARLSEAIAADPMLEAEHRLIAALGETDTARHAFPGELGFARLSKAIDRETQRGREPVRVWRRAIPAWQAVAGIVFAIFAWQLVATSLLVDRSEPPQRYTTATGPAGPRDGGARARVAFVPEASEASVRALLREAGARIVDGPNALGFYVLAFDDTDARDAALRHFADARETVALIEVEDKADAEIK